MEETNINKTEVGIKIAILSIVIVVFVAIAWNCGYIPKEKVHNTVNSVLSLFHKEISEPITEESDESINCSVWAKGYFDACEIKSAPNPQEKIYFYQAKEIIEKMGYTTSKTFNGRGHLTREEAAYLLYFYDLLPENENYSFILTENENIFYVEAVQKAVNTGYITPTSINKDGYASFNPNDTLSQEQFLAIMYKYAVRNGYSLKQLGTIFSEILLW